MVGRPVYLQQHPDLNQRLLCEYELAVHRLIERGNRLDPVRLRWGMTIDKLRDELSQIRLDEHVVMGRLMEHVRR